MEQSLQVVSGGVPITITLAKDLGDLGVEIRKIFCPSQQLLETGVSTG